MLALRSVGVGEYQQVRLCYVLSEPPGNYRRDDAEREADE
jgi:hypothetical protein